MPLKFSQVRGRPIGLYLALLGVGVSTAPSEVTVTVDTGGAAEGATSIPVTALSAAIPKNTVLTFDAGGDPLTVVVTADAAAAATSISVEMYEGADGEGLSRAVAAAETATYDQLYTVVGTENAPYTNNPQETNLTAITYGGGSGVSVSTPEIQSVSPQIARTGLFIAEGQVVQDIIQYADTNRNWWVKHVSPDADGNAWMEREGLAKVSGLNQDGPADGLLRLSYNIRFQQIPTVTFL